MNEIEPRQRDAGRAIKAPQNFAGGLALAGVAGLALWLLSDLNAGSLSEMGSALLPRALAIGLGSLGLIIAGIALVRHGSAIEKTELRGTVFVLLSIGFFAAIISSWRIGPVNVPGLGLMVSAPFAIIIAGFATPEARLRELLALAFGLTPVCMLMFGDLLNLPIPILPAFLIDSLPEGWSQKLVLRVTAAVMLCISAGLFATERHLSNSTVDGKQD
ncbi:hypothetical protein ASD54_19350 [Rhizobium sp. Root149]|uniref:tripartite tricarboxylate transporter TctB family protein n=1 Tax=Rhizobium sp. Root149 TaxID=1736473 RepID=UPI000712F1EE|nr:tripartite tricarboxylate transporter TctB family protein [Rhizobium sp. Root149]KQZ48974.1 hypothetical protein ASD54_19350 [Rhizobium sp. Root149]